YRWWLRQAILSFGQDRLRGHKSPNCLRLPPVHPEAFAVLSLYPLLLKEPVMLWQFPLLLPVVPYWYCLHWHLVVLWKQSLLWHVLRLMLKQYLTACFHLYLSLFLWQCSPCRKFSANIFL